MKVTCIREMESILTLWQEYEVTEVIKVDKGSKLEGEFKLGETVYRIKRDDEGDVNMIESIYFAPLNASNAVNHPGHYNQGIEVWDFIISHDLNFMEGNIVKYVARHRHKNGIEDLEKAKFYLEKLIEVEKEKANE